MNQTCKVCGEPAAGFHFGAFTCEGCKSFFGRSYNNLSSISECKNSGKCIIDKKNRTTCKACRLRKCYTVGMSKGGSRYGRRSNWFKIHCLLQEQQQQAVEAAGKAAAAANGAPNGFGDMAAAAAAMQQHQQQQQQRSSHMAAQHMNGLLGYPGYLPPDMMQSSSAAAAAAAPFLSAAAAAAAAGRHHPADAAAAAAALPFFSMMNSLPPSMGGGAHPQSAFQLPPHLLFPGYHPGGAAAAAAAAAAADAAYRSEMFKHRQSVDSATSAESQQRYSPSSQHVVVDEERVPSSALQSPSETYGGANSTASTLANEEHPHALPFSHPHQHQHPHYLQPSPEQRRSVLSQHSISPVMSTAASTASIASHHTHQIHSPIAIRATPKAAAVSPIASIHTERQSPAASAVDQVQATPLSFAAKMQSLSPVSVCSIGAETATPAHGEACEAARAAIDQDCPMDLSMKTSRSSVHSFNTSASRSGGAASDSDSSSEEESQRCLAASAAATQAVRRKFYQLAGGEHESDASSDASASEAVKRQKLASDAAATAQSYNGYAHSATSLRGIFVCV